MTPPVVTPEDVDRFQTYVEAFGRIGATDDGGVRRLAGSPADGEARAVLRAYLRDLGAIEALDRVGNQFGRLALGGEQGAVLCGSHLDSQPTGGRLDGSLGIAAALAAAHVLRREAISTTYLHDLIVCNWTNEEGARFTPSLTGSSVFSGAVATEDALDTCDAAGQSLEEALALIGFLGTDCPPADAVAAVELHVEQGPHLERAGATVGVVSGSWGARKIQLCFRGEPAHTGPTAKHQRRDALLAASRFVALAHDLADRHPADPVLSIARIENFPNSANVIASETRLWIEIRHADAGVCRDLGQTLLEAIPEVSGGCAALVEQDTLRQPTRLAAGGRSIAQEVCRRQGVRWRAIPTVAGHDVLALSAVVPATLLFVPSRAGLSHTPKEFTPPEDLVVGFKVLVEWLHWRMLGVADARALHTA